MKVTKTQTRALLLCVWHSMYGRHKRGRHVLQKCTSCHEPTFLCSSLTESAPKWLRPEDLKFKATNYYCCMNFDRTTMPSLQRKYLHIFHVFRPACTLALGDGGGGVSFKWKATPLLSDLSAISLYGFPLTTQKGASCRLVVIFLFHCKDTGYEQRFFKGPNPFSTRWQWE